MKILLSDYCPSWEGTDDYDYMGAFWRQIAAGLAAAGHEPIWYSIYKPPLPTGSFDAVYAIYRWPMPGRFHRHLAYVKQQALFDQCIENGIPITVFDADHMIPPDDRLWLHSVICAPELRPRAGVMRLMYPEPEVIGVDLSVERTITTAYVGNDYYRGGSMLRFMGDEPMTIAGSWHNSGWKSLLQKRGYTFLGKQPFTEVLNRAEYTVAFGKHSYYETGYVTLRWLEAAFCGCKTLIPAEFQGLPPALSRYQTERFTPMNIDIDEQIDDFRRYGFCPVSEHIEVICR